MLSPKKLIIRADANTQMGTGHIMRCLALAQAWQEDGGNTCFVLAFHVPTLEARLKTEGIEIIHLDVDEPGNEEDAMATAVIAHQYQAQWIVVDGYHFDAEYQQRLKSAGFWVLFIDDYGHAAHYYADVVLNQNIYAQSEMYAEREQYTQLLLGTKYALLRREFWSWREWQRQFPEKARKILVTLGGSDPDNVTLTVIQALRQLPYDALEAIVLVGGNNPHYQDLETAVSQDNRIKLRQNVTNMPELMAWADLAVSAGGSTNWELAFMGTPNLIIILADNQIPVAQGLSNANISINLGWYEQIEIDTIKDSLNGLLTSTDLVQQKRQEGRGLVDGYGVERIIEVMENYNDYLTECDGI